MNYCPLCATPLETRVMENVPRLACSAEACTYVHWDNPVPVVAALVQYRGGVLLALTAVHLARRWRARGQHQPPRPHRAAAPFFGLLAGFTTMVANAGGAVMSLYLLSSGYAKLGFLGTGAFAVVVAISGDTRTGILGIVLVMVLGLIAFTPIRLGAAGRAPGEA